MRGLKTHSNHSPQEVSSKIPPSKAVKNLKFGLTKPERRDPRFERTSGKFNQDLYEKAYGFVYEYQADEIRELEKKIKETKDLQAVSALRKELQSKKSRLNARKEKLKRREIVQEWKKSERKLVSKGKKPYFLKKSDIDKIQLLDKYKEITSKGQSEVNKYIEHKNKKRASSSKKVCPR